MYFGKILEYGRASISTAKWLIATIVSVQAAEEIVAKDKEKLRQGFEELRTAVKDGRTVTWGQEFAPLR